MVEFDEVEVSISDWCYLLPSFSSCYMLTLEVELLVDLQASLG